MIANRDSHICAELFHRCPLRPAFCQLFEQDFFHAFTNEDLIQCISKTGNRIAKPFHILTMPHAKYNSAHNTENRCHKRSTHPAKKTTDTGRKCASTAGIYTCQTNSQPYKST
ncbi:Uncharacterised protein [Bacteroides xylanisolvens]|nr:Uncharacterised protein [Bacteroides xylanisolvens]